MEEINLSENNLVEIKQHKISKKKKSKIGIIYHYPCYDGGYSAMNAYLYYTYLSHKKKIIHFFPSNSNNRLNEVNFEKYGKIYILDKGLNEEDFTFLAESMKKFENKKIKIILIDHHISSIKLYDSLDSKFNFEEFKNFKVIFDDKAERSACGLSFDYFKNKSLKKFTKVEVEEIFTENYKLVYNAIKKYFFNTIL